MKKDIMNRKINKKEGDIKMKKGISLITLIITIIVIIILAGAVILSLNNTNIIGNAEKAVEVNKIATYKDALNLSIASLSADSQSYVVLNVPFGKQEGKEFVIKKYIPQMTDDEAKVLGISNNELVLTDGEQTVINYNNVKDIIKKVGTIEEKPLPEVPTEKTGFTNNGNELGAAIMKPELHGMKALKVNGLALEETTSEDKDWYKYVAAQDGDNGLSHWANAVTKDGSAHFVWIPRYAYKITGQSIDVVFIDTNDKTAEGGEIPEGYTVHSAFNIPGKKLPGIWVGKYESSNNNENIAIKPGVTSWKTINVSTIFENCYNMQNNPSYGFIGLEAGTTHMMKNTEWGAVAYLAHSKYGRNGTEVTINNNSDYITGIAGDSVSANSSTATTNAWNTTAGVNASTTNNVSGIYDMSGGAWEYVAGNYNWTKLNAGSQTKFDELFNAKNEKYFDVYTSKTGKAGDATTETSGWYGDYSGFGYGSYPWFRRGGSYHITTLAGLFSCLSDNGTGLADSAYGFRVVLFG